MVGQMSSEQNETSLSKNADNLQRSIVSTSESTCNNVVKEQLAIEERLTVKMFSHEVICFLVAITFTALAALHSSSPKISKPPVARPFFDQSSVVLDFYKGHLGAMIERVTQADFSFVMYYAPWDAESQTLRQEFESVAQFYHLQICRPVLFRITPIETWQLIDIVKTYCDNSPSKYKNVQRMFREHSYIQRTFKECFLNIIFFAAINCWHPDSECRIQYNKIYGYPVLMLYLSRDSGISYRGIRTAPYMIRFLDAFINPIVRIMHKEQLMELLVSYDAVVVGYFNFTRLDRTPGYREFYKAAVHSLERDPNRELVFAIVTSASSSQLHYGVYKFPSANLFMWNESLSYPENSEWICENILNWISSSIHQPSLWLQPPGVKALTLAPYLHEGPVLFLFTPRNPFYTENYIYNLVREIGLQYYNCAENVLVKEIIARLEAKRLTAVMRHLSRNKECISLLNDTSGAHVKQIKESITSVSIQQWINNSCENIAMNKCFLCKTKIISPLTEKTTCAANSEKFDGVCKDSDIFTASVIVRQCEKQISEYNKQMMKLQEPQSRRININVEYETSLLEGEYDPLSASVVRRAFLKERCRKWLAGNNYNPSLFPRDSPKWFNVSLKESVCETNKTLALIAIDSLHYFQFAERFGVDISKRRNKTTVIILDSALESQYVMHHDFSKHTLIDFINNYTQGFLGRTLRSDNSQRYEIKNSTNKDNRNNIDLRTKIHVQELTSETFLDTILDPYKDIVIMYHSPYCGFCSAVSYVYLTIAHYLSNMDHLIFVKVDGDNNDLPWEYNMNHFPSILFFPAKRKEDSTVFPFSVPITIPNLLNFVLANLGGDSQVEALINVCQTGSGEAPNKCIARIRYLCLDIIQQFLQDYRKLRRHLNFLDKRIARNKHKIILLKLEHIRDIHFILGTTIDLGKDRKKTQLIKKKFSKYYKDIRILETDNKIEKRHYKLKSTVHESIFKRNNEIIKSE